MPTKQIKAIVSGKVQGVGYRASTRSQAQRLGVCGYVKNLPDGDVEIVACGEAEKVDKLLDWAKTGPSSAVVDDLKVEHTTEVTVKSNSFKIRY